MPNREHQYYVGNDVTFKGTFKINGVAQIPDASSATASIYKLGETTPTVAETTAIISSAQLQYKYTPLVVGRYSIFLTCTFNTGVDKRTGQIEFVVRKKEAH